MRAWIRVLAGVLTCAMAATSCTTGETSEDQHTRAVRDMVRRAGVTEDVAECIVDELEATVGLAVLEDEGASDDLTAQINEIATGCLLVVPNGTGATDGPATTGPTASSAPEASLPPDDLTTTTGAPRVP